MKGAILAMVVAYIMPSYGVLKRFAGQRDELTVANLKAEGVAAVAPVLAKDVSSLMGVTWNSGELMLNASLAVRFPGRCRLELSSTESTKVLAAAYTSGKARSEGGDVQALLVGLEQACALLSLKSSEDGATREAVQKHLSGLKVDQKQVSLARFNGTVSYLIGNKAEGQSSVWIYKGEGEGDPKSFLPSRLMFTDSSGNAWDVRFSDYASQATGEVWPRVLEVYKGNEAQLRVMVLNANTKADLSNVKF
jgi:hypothetical protein